MVVRSAEGGKMVGGRLDLRNFFLDILGLRSGERVLFLVDWPHSLCPDSREWRERREMADDWQRVMEELGRERGFMVWRANFAATGKNSAPLSSVIVVEVKRANLVLAMTEFSASGPLGQVAMQRRNFRAASMPGIQRRMEETALAADYREVQRRCGILFNLLKEADFCQVEFDTGQRARFDLRYRQVDADDGLLRLDDLGFKLINLINLPSGEVCQAPYEGEKTGIPSLTEGELPIFEAGEQVIFRVRENRIIEVSGNGVRAQEYRNLFSKDEARTNIAEVAFGVNPKARAWGNVLEDEKAGFHWAFGLSSHLGGVWGPERFRSPETCLHEDFVYANGNHIQVRQAVLLTSAGSIPIIHQGEYEIF